MNRLIALLLVVWLGGLAWAGPSAQLEQELVPSDTPVPFGKSVELILTFTYPPELEAPAPDTLEIPGAHMLDQFQVQGPDDGSHKVMEYHLVFTRLEPGVFEVPAISVGDAKSTPVKVDFAGSVPLVTDKEGEIRGPKPVTDLSTWDFWKTMLLWIAGILGVLLVVGWLFNQLGILDRLRSPKGRALKRLKRLRKNGQSGDDLILGCVEVLRNYLQDAYGFTTVEATSIEILNQMTMDNRCRELKDSVSGLLDSGDGVKFAKQSLTEAEADDHFENLYATLKVEPKVKP